MWRLGSSHGLTLAPNIVNFARTGDQNKIESSCPAKSFFDMHVTYAYLCLILGASTVLGSSCDGGTINSQSDADAMSSCSIISGDITVIDYDGTSLNISGPANITGNFNVTDAPDLTELYATDLETISGELSIGGTLANLATLDLGSMFSVGSLDWENLPNLTNPSLPASGINSSDSIRLVNTGIHGISWVNMDTTDNVYIADNPLLVNDISLQFSSFTGSVEVSGNGNEKQRPGFGMTHATSGGSIKLSNVSSVQLGNMNHLSGDLELAGSTNGVVRMPNLERVDGSLSIQDNPDTHQLFFNLLRYVVGNITITGNDNLNNYSIMALEEIGGDATFDGAYGLLRLPSVTYIGGTLSVNGTSEGLTCEQIKSRSYAECANEYTCQIGVKSAGTTSLSTASATHSVSVPSDLYVTSTSPAGSTSSSSSSPSSSSSKDMPTGEKVGLGVGIGVGVPVIFGAALFFVLTRRKRTNNDNDSRLIPEAGGNERYEAPANEVGGMNELAVEGSNNGIGFKNKAPVELPVSEEYK
ncbi:hypothetical protein N7456_013219 [Penicillium angulare]|uniref:Uncharacterized protein n=1 Tax=Penicillium angulare TaxID=116970 RepID=A0A9W9JWM4_9EURO|nr:hypothetical protein N7456_013219 [Penicillium angulare]